MPLPLRTLEAFWAAAARHGPLIIVGAGRWGRVWTDVISSASGSTQGVAIVARSNLEDTLAWRDRAPARARLRVFGSLDEAIPAMQAGFAIIASRPRDHISDVRTCLAAGLPSLVEKPFATDPDEADAVLRSARDADVTLGVGTEFSFLPDLHALADQLGDWRGEAVLDWEDPIAEIRHGAAKRVHDEASVLEDLLPHALSIFEVLEGSGGAWRMDAAGETPDRVQGQIDLRTKGRRYRLNANHNGAARVRRLSLAGDDGRIFVLDFAAMPSQLTCDSGAVARAPGYAALSSVLRLELGAWMSALAGTGSRDPAIIASLPQHIDLHRRLQKLLGAAS